MSETKTCGTCSYFDIAQKSHFDACDNYEPRADMRDFDVLAGVARDIFESMKWYSDNLEIPQKQTIENFKRALADCGVEVK